VTNGRYSFDLKAVAQWRSDTAPIQNGKAGVSLTEARTRKECALAGLREIQLRQKRGELVLVSEVRAERFRTGRMVRDRLENVPSRVCVLCAAETDQHRIHDLLMKEIREALEELCDGTPQTTTETEPAREQV